MILNNWLIFYCQFHFIARYFFLILSVSIQIKSIWEKLFMKTKILLFLSEINLDNKNTLFPITYN